MTRYIHVMTYIRRDQRDKLDTLREKFGIPSTHIFREALDLWLSKNAHRLNEGEQTDA